MNYNDNKYTESLYRSNRNRKPARLRRRRIRQKIKIAVSIIKLMLILGVISGIYLAIYNSIILKQDKNEKQVMEGPTEEVSGMKINKEQVMESPTEEVSERNNNMLDEIYANKEKYPVELLESLEKNPEILEFVYKYPDNKNRIFNIDISEDINSGKIPLFLQWDERWGYSSYGDSIIGVSGCGPTCLSMVASYILHDETMNPKWMAEFSEKNGYVTENNATLWALMNQGAKKIGLDSIVLPLDENRVLDNLEAGNPIICSMGPGDFTTEGHFIVMTGVKNGRIVVNDPNSRERSEKLWEFSSIKDQIKNMWVFRYV